MGVIWALIWKLVTISLGRNSHWRQREQHRAERESTASLVEASSPVWPKILFLKEELQKSMERRVGTWRRRVLVSCEVIHTLPFLSYSQREPRNILFVLNVYLFILRWGVSEGGPERQRERERRTLSKLCTVSTEPDARLELTNSEIMIWAEIKSQMLNLLSHPGTPTNKILLRECLVLTWTLDHYE